MKKIIYHTIFYIGLLSRFQMNVNVAETGANHFDENFMDLTLTSKLQKITLPTLLIAGNFNFIVPKEVLYNAYNNISSEQKEILIFNNSAHSPFLSEPGKFVTTMKNFIENNK